MVDTVRLYALKRINLRHNEAHNVLCHFPESLNAIAIEFLLLRTHRFVITLAALQPARLAYFRTDLTSN